MEQYGDDRTSFAVRSVEFQLLKRHDDALHKHPVSVVLARAKILEREAVDHASALRILRENATSIARVGNYGAVIDIQNLPIYSAAESSHVYMSFNMIANGKGFAAD